MTWCRHHSHDDPRRHKCALGVDVNKLVTEQCGPSNFGRHYMLPCHDSALDDIRKATCDKQSLFTPEEVAEQEAETERHLQEATRRLMLTLPLVERIKTDAKGGILTGHDPCPACENGTIHWSVAQPNLHVRAHCTTDDCVNFIE